MSAFLAACGLLSWGVAWAISVPFAADRKPTSSLVAAVLFTYGALALFSTAAYISVVA